MKISCPQCGFSRDVPEDRLPPGAAIATCPKCGCRFRLSGETRDAGESRPSQLGENKNQGSGEEEEDIRLVASRAYAAEAERFERQKKYEEARAAKEAEINPWDAAPEPGGWFAAFYQTIIRVMFSAPAFFRSLRPRCQQLRPLAFYLIIAILQTALERMWSGLFISMLSSSAANDPQLEKMLEMLGPQSDLALALILRCGLLALQLYLLSFLMYLAYRVVAPRRATFALIFQIMAYSSAPAILCFVPILGSIAGWIWGLACLLVGCRAALEIDWPRTLFGLLPLLLIFAPVFIQLSAILGQ